MKTLPIQLNLEGRRCLVVGGSAIALQKVEVLTASQADVHVVAPFILRSIEALPGVTVSREPFRPDHLDGAVFVIAATDDAPLNHRIHALAKARGMLVNVVDDPPYCDFIFPSILRRGDLSISVSTGGAGPALARMLRRSLESDIDPAFNDTLADLHGLRRLARERIGCPGARRAAIETLSAIILKARGRVPPDLPGRMREVIDRVSAPAPIPDLFTDASKPSAAEPPVGVLSLVGAGPGDPGLLTLAGARALHTADLVLYDRLVNPDLLAHAPAAAERICVGKRPGESHEQTQGRINRLLTDAARAGRHVVRLKGGDPFIFGRGGEELSAADAAGIPAHVIPGITAALGAAATCGFPLTQRHLASSVAFVTGCPAADSPRPATDWRALARSVDTVVLYMGVRHLAEIAREMIAAGRPAAEPALAVVRATQPDQSVHPFTLEMLADGAAEVEVSAPAVVIIGQVLSARHPIVSE